MPTKSKSRTTTSATPRLPSNRPPTHPGKMLLEEFVKPLGLTQTELATRLGVSFSASERDHQWTAVGHARHGTETGSGAGDDGRLLVGASAGLGLVAHAANS